MAAPRIRWFGALAPLALALTGQAAAQDLTLELPVSCTLGDDCYIQNFVDHDPGDGHSDFACGTLSYDGHKGTDFALPLRSDLGEVDVLAAAAGTVRGVRDGMPDISIDAPEAPDITGRDCGNGVVIDHGNGWETQYCHLARGSVLVETGQEVQSGDRLGQIGLSGRTQFPHLHLSVRKDGAVVDPFDPDGQITCGAPSDETLWAAPVNWAPGGLLDIGFASAVPDYTEVKSGTASEDLTPTSPAMVLFVFMFGSQAGDTITLTITRSDTVVFQSDVALDRPQAQLFRAGGRRTPEGGWPAGVYTGTASLTRNGAEIDRLTTRITLE